MKRLKIGQRIVFGMPFLASAALALPLASQAARPAPGPRAPAASTGGAAQISGSSATLEGTINPHGAEVSYYFQYGPTAVYGAQTPATPAGGGTMAVRVSQPVSGLQLGTTYHFRLVAVTSAGTTTAGQDRSFTTKKIPLKFTIGKLLGPVVFGNPVTIAGTLTGTGGGDRQVVLEGSPFPYLGIFTDIGAPQTTNAGGGFSFSFAGLSQNTRLRVATLDTPPISSSAVTVRVAVRVTLHMRSAGPQGLVRLYGTVTPSVVGAGVAFQLLRPGLGPATVGGTVVRKSAARVSRFSSTLFVRHGRGGSYRAFVKVANGKQVSGSSPTILIRSAPARARRTGATGRARTR
jgi:hypothetical protein